MWTPTWLRPHRATSSGGGWTLVGPRTRKLRRKGTAWRMRRLQIWPSTTHIQSSVIGSSPLRSFLLVMSIEHAHFRLHACARGDRTPDFATPGSCLIGEHLAAALPSCRSSWEAAEVPGGLREWSPCRGARARRSARVPANALSASCTGSTGAWGLLPPRLRFWRLFRARERGVSGTSAEARAGACVPGRRGRGLEPPSFPGTACGCGVGAVDRTSSPYSMSLARAGLRSLRFPVHSLS